MELDKRAGESFRNKRVLTVEELRKERREVGVRLGLLVRVGATMGRWEKWSHRSRDRFFRLKQLVTTEDDYLNSLLILRDHVRLPLLQQHLLTPEEASRIFANLDIMIELSEKLRGDLSGLLKSWDRHRSMLGTTMKTYVRFFLIYKDYFRNMDSSQARIKRLLQEEPRAREIEQTLRSCGRTGSFEDLLIRPFQRPLKYHLILRDYEKKIPKGHPDMLGLADTLEAFRSVNQDNNEALNKRDKSKRLQELDQKFGNIMREGQASRTYEAEFEAILFDQIADLFIFSDIILLSFRNKETPNPEVRVELDRWSSLESVLDGCLFNNQFFLFGSNRCLHISFLQPGPCQECSQIIRTVIRAIQVNEATREQGLRTTNRSIISGTSPYSSWRESMTSLPAQVCRPFVVRVVGWDSRTYFEDRAVQSVVLELSAGRVLPGELVPRETVLIDQAQIFRVEKLARQLYPQVDFIPLDCLPKGVLKSKLENNPQMRRELRGILIQLMLNTLLRTQKVAKRVDIFAHLLGASELLWAFLIPHRPCSACKKCTPLLSPHDYRQEQRHRLIRRQELSQKRIFQNQGASRFCQRKTVEASLELGRLPLSLVNGEGVQGRLQWLKARKGATNHTLSQPLPASTRMGVKVKMCGVGGEGVEVQIKLGERVGQVVERLGERLGVLLGDCELVAEIGDDRYLLSQDESIGPILARSPEPGLFGFSLFQKEPLKVHLSIRKVLFLEPALQACCGERELQVKVQELVWRLRVGQVRLPDHDTYAKILACYYCYKHFIELDTLSYYLVRKRAEQLDRLLPPRLRHTLPDPLYRQIEKIKADHSLSDPSELARRVVRGVLEAPAGSCYFMEAQLLPDGIKVEVGADWRGVWVRDRSSVLFNFQFGQGLKVSLTGWELRVQADKQYLFFSREMWKLKEIIEVMQDYYWSFVGGDKNEKK